jgi:thioredoxin reductase (NADPH)
MRLQVFLSRNAHPHMVLDAARDGTAAELMKIHAPRPEELPLVVCPDGTVLKRPTEQTLARHIGLLPELNADHIYDVAIVGAGPAGLAAAVYAASSGLSVLVLETRVIGGQIGASARIENYLGFPTGISGAALAGRAIVQAQKFGADIAVPAAVTRLDCTGSPLRIHVDCGLCLSARTAVIATGAKYRRPDIPNLANYEGRGVHYWASPIEAKLCQGEEIVLVGGGNSAGQAVAYLARHAARVHMLIRGSGLESTMSSYLIERIAALPNVTLHVESEIVALEGGRKVLSAVRWRDRRRGTEVTKPIRRVFLFVGADPNTGWLP